MDFQLWSVKQDVWIPSSWLKKTEKLLKYSIFVLLLLLFFSSLRQSFNLVTEQISM